MKYIGKFIIGNCYRPPKGNFTNYINYLTDLSTNLKQFKNIETYILGDNNVNLSEHNNKSKLLIDSMKLCNLRQIISVNTRLGVNKKTLLDHIFTN